MASAPYTFNIEGNEFKYMFPHSSMKEHPHLQFALMYHQLASVTP